MPDGVSPSHGCFDLRASGYTTGHRFLCYDVLHNRDAQATWTRYVHALYGTEANATATSSWYQQGEWDAPVIPPSPGFSQGDARQRAYRVHINKLVTDWAARLRARVKVPVPPAAPCSAARLVALPALA